MKKEKILFLFIVLSVALSGCLDFLFEDPITQEAIDKKDPEICKQLDNERDKLQCFRKVAVADKNPDICKNYLKDNAEAQDDCYMYVGPEVNNLDICNKITDPKKKSECYMQIGINKKDANICSQTKKLNEQAGSECYKEVAISKNNPDLCAESTGRYKDDCYAILAENNNRVDLCKEVNTLYLKENCYQNIAEATNKPEICDNLPDPDKIAACKGRVTGDINACNRITDSNKKEQCYAAAASRSGNEDGCVRINNPQLKETCYQNVAAATGKESLCDKANPNQKDRCLSDVAKKNKNPATCEKIKDIYEQNICFENIAIATNKKDVCENIADPERQKTCEERVKERNKEEGGGLINDLAEGIGGVLGGGEEEEKSEEVVEETAGETKATDTADGKSSEGVIDKPLEYGLDDLDDNGCNPVQIAVKTSDGDTICQCKPGYKKIYLDNRPYCQFDKPEGTGMSDNDLKKVEHTIRNLWNYESKTITVKVDGKEVEVGILRKANHQVVYTVDGQSYGDLGSQVNPGTLSQIGSTLGGALNSIGDGISWMFTGAEHKNKNPETDLRYDLGKDTLSEYSRSNSRLTTLQRDHFAQAFVKYVDERESGRTWDQVHADPGTMFMGGPGGKGGGSEIALSDKEYFLIMEEAYQKYKLMKELED